MTESPQIVTLLDADDDLARALPADALSAARRHSAVPAERLPAGKWNPSERYEEPPPGTLGLMLLDGMLMREVHLGASAHVELLGAGDVIRPWDEDRAMGSVVPTVSWVVLVPTRVAVLSRRFAVVAGRWPELADELMCRALRRARSQSALAAISNATRVDVRVLGALWHLAERWGTVGPEGTHLDLRLTHATLARIVGARRPTVTTALTQLATEDKVRRGPHGTWILLAEPQGWSSASEAVARRAATG